MDVEYFHLRLPESVGVHPGQQRREQQNKNKIENHGRIQQNKMQNTRNQNNMSHQHRREQKASPYVPTQFGHWF